MFYKCCCSAPLVKILQKYLYERVYFFSKVTGFTLETLLKLNLLAGIFDHRQRLVILYGCCRTPIFVKHLLMAARTLLFQAKLC